MPFETGPYLQAAVFCEKVLDEKDGVLSLIRMVDRLYLRAESAVAPEQMPAIPISLFLVVTLKSGAARGSHILKVRPETPAGLRSTELGVPVLLEGEDRGTNFVYQLSFLVDQEGLYWFDVLFDEALLTRMPLRIVYQRVSLGRGPNAGG